MHDIINNNYQHILELEPEDEDLEKQRAHFDSKCKHEKHHGNQTFLRQVGVTTRDWVHQLFFSRWYEKKHNHSNQNKETIHACTRRFYRVPDTNKSI